MRYQRQRAQKETTLTDAPTKTFQVVDEINKVMDNAAIGNSFSSTAIMQTEHRIRGAQPQRLAACKRLYFTILNSKASKGIIILRN